MRIRDIAGISAILLFACGTLYCMFYIMIGALVG